MLAPELHLEELDIAAASQIYANGSSSICHNSLFPIGIGLKNGIGHLLPGKFCEAYQTYSHDCRTIGMRGVCYGACVY